MENEQNQETNKILKKFGINFNRGRANTAPAATNYDVHSPQWEMLGWCTSLSAMEATDLGHEPS